MIIDRDVSKGSESGYKVRIVNNVDGKKKPAPFTYINKMMFSDEILAELKERKTRKVCYFINYVFFI